MKLLIRALKLMLNDATRIRHIYYASDDGGLCSWVDRLVCSDIISAMTGHDILLELQKDRDTNEYLGGNYWYSVLELKPRIDNIQRTIKRLESEADYIDNWKETF